MPIIIEGAADRYIIGEIHGKHPRRRPNIHHMSIDCVAPVREPNRRKIWRPVLSLFYPPVIIRGKNGKNSESPVGSNKNEKRKPKSAVYRSFWASVVYFHLRLISTKNHKGEMTRNAVGREFPGARVQISSSPPPYRSKVRFAPILFFLHYSLLSAISHLLVKLPLSGNSSPVSIACAEVILEL